MNITWRSRDAVRALFFATTGFPRPHLLLFERLTPKVCSQIATCTQMKEKNLGTKRSLAAAKLCKNASTFLRRLWLCVWEPDCPYRQNPKSFLSMHGFSACGPAVTAHSLTSPIVQSQGLLCRLDGPSTETEWKMHAREGEEMQFSRLNAAASTTRSLTRRCSYDASASIRIYPTAMKRQRRRSTEIYVKVALSIANVFDLQAWFLYDSICYRLFCTPFRERFRCDVIYLISSEVNIICKFWPVLFQDL